MKHRARWTQTGLWAWSSSLNKDDKVVGGVARSQVVGCTADWLWSVQLAQGERASAVALKRNHQSRSNLDIRLASTNSESNSMLSQLSHDSLYPIIYNKHISPKWENKKRKKYIKQEQWMNTSNKNNISEKVSFSIPYVQYPDIVLYLQY